MSESKTQSQVPQSLEPKAGRVPVPLWAVTLVGIFTFVGIARLVDHGGAFDPNVYGSFSDFAQVDRKHPKAPEPWWRPIGRKVYSANCASCHQANGGGTPGLFPPLAASDWVLAEGTDRLQRILFNGMIGPVKVSGAEYNGNMPAWNALSDQEIAAVISYIRNQWGNKGSEVTPEEIAAIRKKYSGRDQWKADDLMAIPLTQPAAKSP